MADSDYNMIKPVEGLPNIPGLTPARRREERKRRHHLRQKQKEKTDEEPDGVVNQENLGGELGDDGNDHHSIDYCA
jgi:hypothetical protein